MELGLDFERSAGSSVVFSGLRGVGVSSTAPLTFAARDTVTRPIRPDQQAQCHPRHRDDPRCWFDPPRIATPETIVATVLMILLEFRPVTRQYVAHDGDAWVVLGSLPLDMVRQILKC